MRARPSHRRAQGGTLIMSLLVLSLLALVAAHTLRRVEPKLRMVYQTAGWQEARVAAEAGVDVAMGELSRNAVGHGMGSWTHWRQENNGVIGTVLDTTLSTVNSVLSLLGGPARISQPIFLDNLRVSVASGMDAATDVQLWAVYPDGSSQNRWFRIRSMATCSLPAQTYTAPSKLDAKLRRYSLRQLRPQLSADDVGLPMDVSNPSSSRTIEVLVEPIMPFELAILTKDAMSLSTSGVWTVDSFDSRDAAKSAPDGTYPGRTSPLVQENGHIASNLTAPPTSPYAALIAARGTRVRGIVATNGGDDPNTSDRENVSGAIAVDPQRVRSDFYRDLPTPNRPPQGLILPAPILGLPFVAGPEAAPTQYVVGGDLGGFSVIGPPVGKGAITIIVNGGLNVTSPIRIPPNTTAQIYVSGDIDFHSSEVNSSPGDSRRAANLQIYGEAPASAREALRAANGASITAAFYGPGYDIKFTDDVAWSGAVVGRTFEMLGGGTSGFHYDEALAKVGAPIGFRIVRYVEDVRR